jgi:Ca2+-binding RTX toxin-like protein
VIADGKSADAYMSIWASAANDLGALTVGNVSMAVNGESAYGWLDIYAMAGDTAGTLSVGDFDLSVDNGAAAGWGFLEVSITNTVSDVVLGNIDLSTSTVQVAPATNTVSVDFEASAGGDLTVGDITVSGGDGLADNFATLTGWLDLNAGGAITIGNVDYSAYGAKATIDVSTFKGAAEIAGGAKADVITDNKGTNAITGDGGADRFVFVDGNTGKTLASMDQIMDFSNAGGDKIDLSVAVNVGNYSEAEFADFSAFTAGANAADKAVLVGNVAGTGLIAAVDFNADNAVDFMIQLVGLDNLNQIDVASFV